MVFTSYTYVAFLALVFWVHWSVPMSWRKPFLIVASYVFYCSWQWQLGFLLMGVSLFNWFYARWILAKWPTTTALMFGVAASLAPLVYFKYTAFLVANAASLADWMGSEWRPSAIDIILPLGISFFTFQGIAYLVDVASGDQPVDSLIDFMLFKAFWPQLIAGPIIRLHEIREQLEVPRSLVYDDVSFGCRRILQGFFKKVVLADTLAPIVDIVFLSSSAPNAVDCAVGIFGFGMQIYFDFSAYSDIAIGSARLFGYHFPENFNWPYASASPADFWNRWHMTLSRWIRDYIFTPLTFMARNRPALASAWLLVAMALCGLWHGANWTFILWGLWHGVLLVANRTVFRSIFPRPAVFGEPAFCWRHLPAIVVTFVLVNLGWVLFRSQSLDQCGAILQNLFTLHGGLRPSVVRENSILVVAVIFAAMVAAHVLQEIWAKLAKQTMLGLNLWRIAKPLVYTAMILAVIVFDQESQTFVYFQF